MYLAHGSTALAHTWAGVENKDMSGETIVTTLPRRVAQAVLLHCHTHLHTHA